MKIQLSELRRVAAPLSIALVVAAAFATTAAAAGRSPVQVTQATDVAGSSPYTGRHCNIPTPDWVAPGGVEAEPTVAVNPRDAENKIAAWMDPTRSSIDTSYTRDGGKTWIKSVPKGVDACGGNHQQAWEASGDVWLSFGPDGTAYLTTLAWAHFVTAPTSDYVSVVYVLVSRNGGKTWSKPALVSRPRGVSDKDMIVADPHHSGTVYDAFDNAGFGLVGPPRGSNYLVVAKSTDWGHNWTRTVVARFPPDRPVSDSQLSILPDGNLVETAVGTNAAGVGTILGLAVNRRRQDVEQAIPRSRGDSRERAGDLRRNLSRRQHVRRGCRRGPALRRPGHQRRRGGGPGARQADPRANERQRPNLAHPPTAAQLEPRASRKHRGERARPARAHLRRGRHEPNRLYALRSDPNHHPRQHLARRRHVMEAGRQPSAPRGSTKPTRS